MSSEGRCSRGRTWWTDEERFREEGAELLSKVSGEEVAVLSERAGRGRSCPGVGGGLVARRFFVNVVRWLGNSGSLVSVFCCWLDIFLKWSLISCKYNTNFLYCLSPIKTEFT